MTVPTFSKGICEMTNSIGTYETIAKLVLSEVSQPVPWTDEKDSRYDILFSYQPKIHIEANLNLYLLQGGIRSTDLFVCIMRKGAFGFKVDGPDSSAGYVSEKLNIDCHYTAQKLADLINGIRKEILKQTKKTKE